MNQTSPAVVSEDETWPPLVKGQLVGLARWILFVWGLQLVLVLAVGIWIALELRASRATEHEDTRDLTFIVQHK